MQSGMQLGTKQHINRTRELPTNIAGIAAAVANASSGGRIAVYMRGIKPLWANGNSLRELGFCYNHLISAAASV